MITWILVAQRAHARIYKHRGPGKGLTLVQEIQHEEGRLRDGELNADRPGRAFDSHGDGRHAMEPQELPHERVAADFARSLARLMSERRLAKKYDQLILVAEPRMLGLLRNALDTATAQHLRGSLDKEYPPEEQDKLERSLDTLIPV